MVVDQFVQQLSFLLRLREAVPEHHKNRRDDLQVRRTLGCSGPGLHVCVEVLRRGQVGLVGEDHFCRLSGDRSPCLGCPGLHDDRASLDGPGNVEWATDGEAGALMVEYVQLLRVEVETALCIPAKGIFIPAFP